jgi:3-dehydroquinate dehydratase II
MRFPEKPIRVLCVNGPNLNLLGVREPGIYGKLTLPALNREIRRYAASRGVSCRFYQSNHEGRIIDFIHRHFRESHGMVINPGALTHTSYALRDAISGTALPTVEVHISDIHKREPFRRISVVKPVCIKQISGYGKKSYFMGLDALLEWLGGR